MDILIALVVVAVIAGYYVKKEKSLKFTTKSKNL